MTETISAIQERNAKTTYGFWVYLMTDCILFAALFATYIVLHDNTAGGNDSSKLFDLPYALAETIILLTSSFTCGLAMLAGQRQDKRQVAIWLAVTFVLGWIFLLLEVTEFSHLHANGNGWDRSAFLSGFFTLVGTHGLHITTGLLWMLVFVPRLLKQGVTPTNARRLALFGMFWHFLDLVWIFIFSIVYLVGAL
jgi:cytochrome o ubiquinol oxidase subunit III